MGHIHIQNCATFLTTLQQHTDSFMYTLVNYGWLLTTGAGVNPRAVNVAFVVDKVTLGQVNLQVRNFGSPYQL
jgi:hypothetical protein